MTHKKIFTIPFRGKREGKTNYKKRLALLKSRKLRLVVRKSNKNMLLQLIKYDDVGDKVIKTITTKDLNKYGWDLNKSNIPSAYLAGLLIGKEMKGKEAILDLGLQTPISGSKLFAALKGAADGGLKINFSEKVLPKEERITGKHIEEYAKSLKGKKEYEKIFSGYMKDKKDPEKFLEYFEKTKQKILS
jgi:large subunit ribosomal protein L18